MEFTIEENEIIKSAIARFKLENKIIEFKKSKENIRIAIDAFHDKYGMMSSVSRHTLMYSILRKCGVKIETPKERLERETKESIIKKKEKKKKLKEDLEKRHKEALEQDIKNMGLDDIDELKPKEPEEERLDVTSAELISNIPETLDKLANPEKKEESKIAEGAPDLDYGTLSNNTVAQLKELADFMKIDYLSNVLKDDLVKKITVVLK